MAASGPYHPPGGGARPPETPQAAPLPQATPLPQAESLPRAQPLADAAAQPQTPISTTIGQPTPQGQPTGGGPDVFAPGGTIAAPAVVADDRLIAAICTRREEMEDEEELSRFATKSAPPWLVSAAFHMLVLILLAISWMAAQPERQIYLSASVTEDEEEIFAEDLGEQLEFDSPLGQDMVDMIEEPVLTPDDLPEVDDPFATPLDIDPVTDGTTATSDLHANQIGYALTGREEGSKKSLLGRYGGTATTEAAVARGLAWLARNQQRDGSWSLVGPYRDGAVSENRPAATAMALLAFQGAGHTHQKGKFRREVLLGWKWLLERQLPEGCFDFEGGYSHRFYTHGQCTIALCELLGMTKDPEYKDAAQRAVQYCLRSQAEEGGWRYSPRSDSDVSVTGWIVMALQSARMAGLEVPQENLDRIGGYLDYVAQEGGSRYPYQRGRQFSLPMTAEALLCRQYLGWPRDDERLVQGVQWITAPGNLIDYGGERDVYFWYYATQVAHHMEGEYWKRWNAVMRQAVPEHQNRSGRESGSWNPDNEDIHESHGGRLYATCLSIYMLEVYYRHLPLYTKVYGGRSR